MYKDLSTVDEHVTDISAINQSIKNILLTRRGSLPGKPQFGSDLYRIIFSQLDTLTETIAENYIKEALQEYETRINVININFKTIPEYNKLVIEIIYSYRDNDFNLQNTTTSVGINI